MSYRLIDRASVDRIKAILQRGYAEAQNKLKDIEWRELPKEKVRSTVYAIDGSQGKQRLSGTIFYAVSSYAFGNGPPYRLVYTNAMLYNQGISDQIIRLQMGTLENKLGYLAGELGKVDYIMMDGTLTGSLTRPPVYPESVKDINALQAILDENFERLVDDFLTELEMHYKSLQEKLKNENRLSEGVILADDFVETFMKRYLKKGLIGYAKKVKIPSCETAPEKIPIPLEYLEKNIGKKVEDILEDVKRKFCRTIVLDDIREAIHVVLSYLEYLYSLDRLLEMDLVYIAKSFYNRRITQRLGIDVVDVPYLDAYLHMKFEGEIAGYYAFPEKVKVEHSIPDVLEGRFKNIEDALDRGVNMAYIRTMKGGVIYLLQSNEPINDELLSRILWHESNGYFRPLQRAHEGVKIEKRAFEAELAALLNIIKRESPELRVFLKYGRSPLE
ncbi:DNA double-strand break repair nuclease NurA [Thermococcus piezophilus]|uniref:5'-3' exonuclease n=1 Tax=Thermococcus piezophilus TaxID=1712654 RepID=A0A172WFP4_9EURY|nr:DNA double-strand break repair nuclease NurA [Thermococcus piezophilus]ANF22215.1 5'-3' exonuclease [Thermococcus piezophilus]